MFRNTKEFKHEYSRRIIEIYGRTVEESDITEKFLVLEEMVRNYASINWEATKNLVARDDNRELHYFSMEFLMGRLLVNNMMNLGIYNIVQKGLSELGINIHELEEIESDCGLGNGGLGRLAACFLDSLASLKYPGHGHTIRYQYGLFRQKIEDGYQIELPDCWLENGFVWEVRKPKHRIEVKFYGQVQRNPETGKYETVNAQIVNAVPYDVPVIGADTITTNTLRLWDAEVSDKNLANQDFHKYIEDVRAITLSLYPDDSTLAGKILRLKQEYFFVAAGVKSIIRKHLRNHSSLDNFAEKNVIQLNDTHPVLAIPELMRLLLDEYDYSWNQAWEITRNTFAYTNHTILAEALEKWPIDIMQNLLPRVYQIVDEIHHRFIAELKEQINDEKVFEKVMILRDGQVHMARLAIVGSFSVNGVARLHSEILVNQELKEFARIFPNKFNNKTNGVTHRRWLRYCNPELSNLLIETIGKKWIHEPERFSDLMAYVNDKNLGRKFLEVKRQKKLALAEYIKEHNGIEVDVDSIFDVQVKRLHAYKRQLLNVLNIIALYQDMKADPNYRIVPRTYIFGAKAAGSYYFAKKVIKLINAVGKVVNNDPETNKYLKVVFLENYGVTLAEKIIPAADVSEQISTAGKEASGTGNMKMMMNGAVTIGTLDGANVEIAERVGDDNIVIFGLKDNEIVALRDSGTYRANDYYNNDFRLKRAIDSLMDGTFSSNRDQYRIIYEELMRKNDEYFVLADFNSYAKAQEKIGELYQDKETWAKMCLVNIAKSGYFSSDRTIEDYVREIWKLKKLET